MAAWVEPLCRRTCCALSEVAEALQLAAPWMELEGVRVRIGDRVHGQRAIAGLPARRMRARAPRAGSGGLLGEIAFSPEELQHKLYYAMHYTMPSEESHT